MRIFITGATGFLGGALARALLEEGAEVHALSRPSSDRQALVDVPIIWHEGDVTVPESLSGLFHRAEWIIHAAGRLGEAGVPEKVYHNVNVDGTRHVMTEVLATGSEARVLYLSSPGVLGPTGPEPVPEDTPFAATNPYERSKAAAEQVALEFAAKRLYIVVARPGFVYGPGDRHVLGLFRAVQRGWFFHIGGGGNLCQPTFIADAVAGMVACLRWGKIGEVYHLAGPRSVSFQELGKSIAAALGVRPPRWNLPRWSAMLSVIALEALARVGGRTPPLGRAGVAFFSEDRVFSWQKAQRELGYTPQHDLATGVPITVAWYRQRGWL